MFGFVYLCVMKMNEIRYNDLSAYLSAHFPYKVQKISLNAGFTCPNRDGTVGYGGCTYCNNQTFNPAYCKTEKTVTEQLEEGKQFFARKYPEMKFLAYFQAYTNTYAELEELKRKYEEALSVPNVVGIVIGTRPDCMPDTLLDYLEDLNQRTFLVVEYGVESTDNDTLKRINGYHRGKFRVAQSREAATDGCNGETECNCRAGIFARHRTGDREKARTDDDTHAQSHKAPRAQHTLQRLATRGIGLGLKGLYAFSYK